MRLMSNVEVYFCSIYAGGLVVKKDGGLGTRESDPLTTYSAISTS